MIKNNIRSKKRYIKPTCTSDAFPVIINFVTWSMAIIDWSCLSCLCFVLQIRIEFVVVPNMENINALVFKKRLWPFCLHFTLIKIVYKYFGGHMILYVIHKIT